MTCNYEARRRGLRKLQLIKDAKRICPDVVIVLGEDLGRFRDASKELFGVLRGFVDAWGGRAERLGFDEVGFLLFEVGYGEVCRMFCLRRNRSFWMSRN